MTPEDRELLQILRRQQLELQRSLARLDVQLEQLEARAENTPAAEPSELPPFPTEHLPPLPLPPEPPPFIPPPSHVPSSSEPAATLPPFPVVSKTAPVPFPPPPPIPREPALSKPSLEFRIGPWLIPIGAISGVFTLGYALTYPPVYHLLGPAGLLGISALVSMVVYLLGERLERSRAVALFFCRTIMAMALAWLYLTAYAAYYYAPLRIIHGPLLAGFLLLLWSAYVLLLAERKKSQVLAVFSVVLAYVSSAINPIGAFTMAADLVLALTGVVFLLRNGWAALSYFSLIGAYLAFLRRLVIGENGEIVLDRALHFWPHAVYLLGAWAIFTAGVLFSNAPSFRGGKRLAFLSLNNGALALLLALATHISGYDLGSLGWAILDSGLLLLVSSMAARVLRMDEPEVSGTYLGQGLALLTMGVIVVYTGISRGVLLALETFFLGFSGAVSRSVILRSAAAVVAFLAVLFLLKDIALDAHHPWLLGGGGALLMALNAWWARRDIRHDPNCRERIVLASSYYCVLSLSLIFAAMYTTLSDAVFPPALALAAVALTFSIYFIPLYELPPMSQVLLLAAQGFALFPAETGEPFPWWSSGFVSILTLLLITWWSYQRITRSGVWVFILIGVYSVVLAGLVYTAARPHMDAVGWFVAASLLSVVFLFYGAFLRIWSVALVGQLFLGSAVWHFFIPPGGWDLHRSSWSWGISAIPISIVFASGYAAHQWLRIYPEIANLMRAVIRFFAYVYQSLALVMLIRWIFAVIPANEQIATFFALGACLFGWNVQQKSIFGCRASYLLTLAGLILYLHRFDANPHSVTTILTGLAALIFIAQSIWLHRAGNLLAQIESWLILLLSAGFGWFFVSSWTTLRIHPHYLVISWTLFGSLLFLLGLLLHERRQRWCGLGIVLAAILHVGLYDFWGFSTGYRVLTFFTLTIVTLGLGFVYSRFADRLKTWL